MSEAGMNSPVEPMTPEQSENKVALSVVQTAGAQLSAARIQQGMSLQQVADQLKLSQRQIQALENNQFELLPKMVIVRGFVRSYAKLLRLDPAPVVACLPSEAGVPGLDADLRPTLATPFMESRTPFLGRQDNNNRKYLIGAALLGVFALLFVGGQKLEQSGYFKGLLTPSATKATEEASASVEPAAASVASVVSESTAPKLAEAPASSVSMAGSSTRQENQEQAASTVKLSQDVAPASAATPAPVIAPVAAAPVSVPSLSTPLVVASPATAETGNNQLKLKFKQDSWIQVKRENGTVVTSHLAKAGTEEFFDMKEALQVRIGNAAGVEGWLRGNAMGIVPGKDSNVVNLNVK